MQGGTNADRMPVQLAASQAIGNRYHPANAGVARSKASYLLPAGECQEAMTS
jgi:hypothetical protein